MGRHTKHLIQLLHEVVDDPRIGAEIGVWKGEGSAHLLREFPEMTLIMVDPFKAYPPESVSQGNMSKKNQEQFHRVAGKAIRNTAFAADRRILMVAASHLAATTVVQSGMLDFVFIDGDHLYDWVKKDIQYWSRAVRLGGLVAGHDYGGPGDREGRYGVKRAVDEWGEKISVKIGIRPRTVWWYKKEEE